MNDIMASTSILGFFALYSAFFIVFIALALIRRNNNIADLTEFCRPMVLKMNRGVMKHNGFSSGIPTIVNKQMTQLIVLSLPDRDPF